MSRRLRRERRRAAQRRSDLDALRQDLENMLRGGVKPGMTPAQVFQLLEIGVQRMAQRMTHEGLATKAPWGLAFDPHSLGKSIESALLLLRSGEQLIDERGDALNLTESEATRAVFQVLSGALTLGAAAILYLRSSPIPFSVARHVIPTEERT